MRLGNRFPIPPNSMSISGFLSGFGLRKGGGRE